MYDEVAMIESKILTDFVDSDAATERVIRPNGLGDSLLTLPIAPALAPFLDRASAPGDLDVVWLREALAALPIGSTIAFATEDVGALAFAGARFIRNAELYRAVERVAGACNCRVSFQEKTSIMHFHRSGALISASDAPIPD
jgi:hypothetical protein